MITYEQYSLLDIDTTPLGLERGDSESTYFCTPKDAKVIGWAGIDGIHYCFFHEHGEMVFAVSPMNTAGSNVHPLAKDFESFLRLLLACGNAAALEQACLWDQAEFDDFQQENPPTPEQQAVLELICEKLLLTPMLQPFDYIKELQAEFDYSSIKFKKDYYDCLPEDTKIPEWKVYFSGDFLNNHDPMERAGKEMSINREFVWGDEVWHVPAIYTCTKGLVIDFCTQISAERLWDFTKKWSLSPKNGRSSLNKEQREQINSENPMIIHARINALLNKKTISHAHGCGLYWNPYLPDCKSVDSMCLMEHYNLDPSCGWSIWRFAFPWATKRKPKINTLSINLKRDLVNIYGEHFSVSAPGDCIDFVHPKTGTHHTLTVHEYECQKMSSDHLSDGDLEFPDNYIAMSYTLSPDMPDNSFSVNDYIDSDRPIRKHIDPNEPEVMCSGTTLIFGGRKGVIAIGSDPDEQEKLYTAYSALHFNQVDDVDWRMVFHEKIMDDITVDL